VIKWQIENVQNIKCQLMDNKNGSYYKLAKHFKKIPSVFWGVTYVCKHHSWEKGGILCPFLMKETNITSLYRCMIPTTL
jgi:hypothetical protein